MTDETAKDTKATAADRERIVERLSDHFAADEIELEEFEQRVALAESAETQTALELLISDLTPHEKHRSTALVKSSDDTALAPSGPTKKFLAVFSEKKRQGAWKVPPKIRATSVLGSTELDFREAVMREGITDLHVRAVLGSVEIYVPPGMRVECDGTAVLADFEELDQSGDDSEKRVLRVHGWALLGSVEIHSRLPGESRRQARKRRKQERKLLREEHRKKRLGDGRR